LLSGTGFSGGELYSDSNTVIANVQRGGFYTKNIWQSTIPPISQISIADTSGNNAKYLKLYPDSVVIENHLAATVIGSQKFPDVTGNFYIPLSINGNVADNTGSVTVPSPTISTGTAAPATTPAKVGDIYVDTTNKKLYFAAGTSSSADWIIAN